MYRLLDNDPNIQHMEYILFLSTKKGLLNKRMLVDKTEVFVERYPYGLLNSSQRYILHNDKETGGLDIFYKFFIDYLVREVKSIKKKRIEMEAMLFVLLLSCWTQSIILLFSFF